MSDGRQYGFGRLAAPDQRDRSYPMRALLAKPPERGARPWSRPRVLDQGATSTCVGHSWRLWLEMAPRLHPPSFGLPPHDIYRQAVRLDEWRENDGEAGLPDDRLQFGTSVRAGAKVMQQAGYIGEYRWAFDAATISDFVTRRDGAPVVVGTNWYAGMIDPDPRTGRVQLSGSVLGGHAWLVRWFDERSMTFTGVSSWGTGWGKLGQFAIRYEDLDRLIRQEQGEACCGVELATRALLDPGEA
jgi:hypothetical protein